MFQQKLSYFELFSFCFDHTHTHEVGTESDTHECEERSREKGEEAIYFLPVAFLAEAVTLPAFGSLRVTALMTPTATVCLMSRTAKRPSGG